MRTLSLFLPIYARPVVMCLIAGFAVPGAAGVFSQAQAADTILYSFTGKADGQSPAADLVFDSKGNLYGTTTAGGSSTNGVVFQLSPKRIEAVLHSFGSVPNDGSDPQAGLTLGTNGILYGTTLLGGTNGCGTFFQLTPAGPSVDNMGLQHTL